MKQKKEKKNREKDLKLVRHEAKTGEKKQREKDLKHVAFCI
jgi:hypothetical protein